MVSAFGLHGGDLNSNLAQTTLSRVQLQTNKFSLRVRRFFSLGSRVLLQSVRGHFVTLTEVCMHLITWTQVQYRLWWETQAKVRQLAACTSPHSESQLIALFSAHSMLLSSPLKWFLVHCFFLFHCCRVVPLTKLPLAPIICPFLSLTLWFPNRTRFF